MVRVTVLYTLEVSGKTFLKNKFCSTRLNDDTGGGGSKTITALYISTDGARLSFLPKR